MFSKFKEKLKGALSIFSKKTEAEAEVVETEVVKAVKVDAAKPEKFNENKQTKKSDLKEHKTFIKEKTDQSIQKLDQKEVEVKPSEEKISQEKKENHSQKKEEARPSFKVEEIDPQQSQEPETTLETKKSFFSRIKEKFHKTEEDSSVTQTEITLPKAEKKIEGPENKLQKRTPEEVASKQKLPEESLAKPESNLDEHNEPNLEEKGFFSKIKEKLTTKNISADKFEELFWDLELLLLENNLAVEVIERIKTDLKRELVNKPLPRDVENKITHTLKQTLQEILSLQAKDILTEITNKEKKPYVIALFGINGAGKTTSLAKLTSYLLRNNHSVVWAASDTFRAAAIQQLEEHAQKLSVKTIKHDYGADAAAVAFDAIKYAEKNNIEVVLIDTAGRLHSNINLMAELEKIIRVAKPDLKLFVGESITGNDCIEQAKQFQQLVDLDGVILTKADVDEKGGAALSISYILKKPILFFGVGQRYEDLEPFDKEKILERLGL